MMYNMLLNIGLIYNLLIQQRDHATCISCNQIYKDPETAQCGHSLCKGCWSEQRYCQVCKTRAPATPRRPNAFLQTLASHCQPLFDAFRKITGHIDDEDVRSKKNIEENNDSQMINVKNWLQNSENVFVNCASDAHPEVVDLHFDIRAKDQQRDCNKNVSNSEIVAYKPPSQGDWDRIEVMPDRPIVHNIKSVHTDTKLPVYTYDNPRRSTRKMDLEMNKRTPSFKKIGKSVGTDRKGEQIKIKSNRIRKLRREFSKINNVRKNKLNVSIENVKKTISVVKTPREKSHDKEFQQQAQSDSCNNTNKGNMITVEFKNNSNLNSPMDKNVILEPDTCLKSKVHANDIEQRTLSTSESKEKEPSRKLEQQLKNIENRIPFHPVNENNDGDLNSDSFISNKILFFKRGKLYNENCRESLPTTKITTINQSSYPEDIHIDFKIGDRVINIALKGKNYIQVNGTTYSCNGKETTDNINYSPERQQKKDKNTVFKHVGRDSSIQTPNERIKISNQLQNLASNEITSFSSRRPENNLEMERSCDDLSVTVVEHAGRIPALNRGPEQLDIFHSMPLDQAHVVEDKRTVPPERAVPDKRALEIDAPIPIAKRVCHSHQAITSMSGSRESDRQAHSENVFSLTESLGGLPTDGIPKTTSDIDSDSDKRNDFHAAKIKHTSCIVTDTDIDSESDKRNDFHAAKIKHTSCIVTDTDIDSESDKRNDVLSAEIKHTSCIVTDTDIDSESDKSNDVHAAEIEHTSCIVSDTDPSVVEASQLPAVLPTISTTRLESTKNTHGRSVELVNPTFKLPCTHAANVREIESSLHVQKQCHQTEACGTPLSITNFVDSIKHNSTPLARKSLRFASPDATLCPTDTSNADEVSNEVITLEKTCQPTAPAVCTPCVAGSSLEINKLTILKLLCTKLGWTFTENYTPELTHLVVTVDDKNRAQRTVKYMCALAAGKWIVSWAWAERCASAGGIVPEEPFEAMDLTLSPAPRRSRTAVSRLFDGFTFFCLPPFSLLDVATLEGMLKASGANVVQSAAAARADGCDPRLVLAAADQSQTPAEDRFIFMAVEHRVVPASVDWVLNCLGAYELYDLSSYLLCPSSLVEEFASRWLPRLLTDGTDLDYDSVPPSP